MRQQYSNINFHSATLHFIGVLNSIAQEYIDAGFRMSIRQLYYQLVARDQFPEDRRFKWNGSKWQRDPQGTPNALPNYKWLIDIATDARMAGLLDWDVIEDRGREFARRPRWKDGKELLRSAAAQFHMDLWSCQAQRVYCVVEKDALVGICEKACAPYDVPVMAARGYPSATVLREFALSDMAEAIEQGQEIIMLHLGDHDPSGIDMSRDLEERLEVFGGAMDFRRIALNMDQIRAQKPPENPAKLEDSRAVEYIARFGNKSWELDALSPQFLTKLIQDNIEPFVDHDIRDSVIDMIATTKKKLEGIAKRFKV